MGYGVRKGVLGSDKSGKIKGAKGPKNPSDVTLPNVKKASNTTDVGWKHGSGVV